MMATEQSTAPVARRLLYRLLLSVAVGLVVCGVSCVVAYRQYLDSGYWVPQYNTLQDMTALSQAIDSYQHERHALPRAWGDLGEVARRADAHGSPLDAWERPLQYWTDGTRYRITSYGRDGRPNGVGLDYDLSSDLLGRDKAPPKRLPTQAQPAFGQFVTDRGSDGSRPSMHGAGALMFSSSVFAGLSAFVLAFVLVGAEMRRRQREGRGSEVAAVVFTVLATLVVGVMMAALDAPSSH